MNLFKIPLLILAMFFITLAQATNVDTTQNNTGTFPIEKDYSASDIQEEEQLKMQRQEEEEEVERDSFGEDEYNKNVDPDLLDDKQSFDVEEEEEFQ